MEFTTFASLDVETNGLFGEAFAVGAVIFDVKTKTYTQTQFTGRCDPAGRTVDWVAANVIPVIGSLPRVPSPQALRSSFWHWFRSNIKAKGIPLFVDMGYPCETRFMEQCQRDLLPGSMYDGPYPLHEVGTLFYAAGLDPDTDRQQYAIKSPRFSYTPLKQHNPYYDAIVSGFCVLNLLDEINEGQL